MTTLATRMRSSTARFDPSMVTGLALWLKADAITGLTDGQAVATWPDASGNSRDATQATAGKRPTYKTPILNGRPVVRFTAASSHEMATPSYSLAQPYILIGVVKADVTSGPSDFHVGISQSGHGIVNAGNWCLWAGALLTGPAASTSPTVLSITVNGASSSIRRNGPTTSVGGAGGANNISGGSNIGASSGTEFWPGDIAELLIYKPVPSAADLLRIEQYLGAKYAIAVS